MFTLSLFGNSIRVYESLFDESEYFDIISKAAKLNIDEATCFLDLEFLKQIGYKHWTKIGQSKEYNLFKIESLNFLELKKLGKRVFKINALELENRDLLFPKYSSFKSNQLWEKPIDQTKKIFICQYETGCFGKYKIDSSSFHLDRLIFKISQIDFFENADFLSSIIYDNIELKSSYDDGLIRALRIYNGNE